MGLVHDVMEKYKKGEEFDLLDLVKASTDECVFNNKLETLYPEDVFMVQEDAYLSVLLEGTLYNEVVEQVEIVKPSEPILLYVGETGSGKTYKAINEAPDGFIIAVPTRQLAYELALDYEQIEGVETGEVFIPTKGGKGKVVVFENLAITSLEGVERLIIDEAHYLNDETRGAALLKSIMRAIAFGIEVVLLTATDTLSEELKQALNINRVVLQPYIHCTKEQVSDEGYLRDLIAEGKSVLVFTKYRPTAEAAFEYASWLGINQDEADFISADVPTYERVQKQLAFKSGLTRLMVSSNVLAQGVNFPSDIVIIEYNEYDDWELVSQKIGRAGRPQYGGVGYYYLHEIPPKKLKKEKLQIRKELVTFSKGRDLRPWNFESFEVPKSYDSYSAYKYGRRFLRTMRKEGLATTEELRALAVLDEEERKLTSLIKQQKRNQREEVRGFGLSQSIDLSSIIRTS